MARSLSLKEARVSVYLPFGCGACAGCGSFASGVRGCLVAEECTWPFPGGEAGVDVPGEAGVGLVSEEIGELDGDTSGPKEDSFWGEER